MSHTLTNHLTSNHDISDPSFMPWPRHLLFRSLLFPSTSIPTPIQYSQTALSPSLAPTKRPRNFPWSRMRQLKASTSLSCAFLAFLPPPDCCCRGPPKPDLELAWGNEGGWEEDDEEEDDDDQEVKADDTASWSSSGTRIQHSP